MTTPSNLINSFKDKGYNDYTFLLYCRLTKILRVSEFKMSFRNLQLNFSYNIFTFMAPSWEEKDIRYVDIGVSGEGES